MADRRSAASLTVVTLVLVLEASASAQVQTLKGRLVDQVCYGIDNANIGDSHPGMAKDCATTCAQKGSSVALLTADGKVYELSGGLAANNNAKLVPHIAHIVQIRGRVTLYRDGTRSIDAKSLAMISQ